MRRLVIAVAVLAAQAAGTNSPQTDCPEQAPPAFIQWAKSHAIPLMSTNPAAPTADLASLKSVIGSARVVGIGESVRLTHEFYENADRLFRFLVSEMGFTGFAMETGFAEAVHVNDYVLGRIPEPPNWEHTWFTWWRGSESELKALVRWMRQYNADPNHERKLHFYGIDVAVPDSSPQAAIDNVLSYLDHVPAFRESPTRATLVRVVQQFLGSGSGTAARLVSLNKYRQLPVTDRDAYTTALSEVVERYFDHGDSGPLTPEGIGTRAWARQSAVAAQQLDAAYRATVDALGTTTPIVENPAFVSAMTPARDRGMADNVLWALEQERPRGRVLVFAHDLHLMKGRLPAGFVQRSAGTARLFETAARMGLLLDERLGHDYVNIASTFYDGDSTGWLPPAAPSPVRPAACGRLDTELARVGPPVFVIDFRTSLSDATARAWLNQASERDYDLNILDAWDAALFVRHITPVRIDR